MLLKVVSKNRAAREAVAKAIREVVAKVVKKAETKVAREVGADKQEES